jgi:hypothetical protein
VFALGEAPTEGTAAAGTGAGAALGSSARACTEANEMKSAVRKTNHLFMGRGSFGRGTDHGIGAPHGRIVSNPKHARNAARPSYGSECFGNASSRFLRFARCAFRRNRPNFGQLTYPFMRIII